LSICVDTATKWRRRWRAAQGLSSLGDAKRSGRPPTFTPVQVAQVKALACRPAADSGLPLSQWSAPELARQVITDRICSNNISASTVRRWLDQEALKPWQYQSWIFITDPHFESKAQRVLDLYARQWQGKPLGDDEFVISSDEKTSIQARCRCHPSLPPGSARTMRVNHDYHRRGAVAYLAAYDVHRAKVFGRCQDTTGITPFEALVEQVMTQEPYRSAKRVFWVIDNGSSHPGQKAIDPVEGAVPQRDHGAHPCPRLLAQPGGDLLLHHPTESSRPTPSPTPTRSSNVWPTSKPATTRTPQRSNGSSPPPTSATSCNAWTATPTTQPPRDHRQTWECQDDGVNDLGP